MDGWMDKQMWYIHILGYYLALKRGIITQVITGINPEDVILSEISPSQKFKYCMILLVWGT